MDIHATVFLEAGKSAVVPQFVTNHGILSGPDLHRLLQQSKVAALFISHDSALYCSILTVAYLGFCEEAGDAMVVACEEVPGHGAVPLPRYFFLIFGSKWTIFVYRFLAFRQREGASSSGPPKYATAYLD